MTDIDHGILTAAEAIRPYLADWFIPRDAADLAQRIAAVLASPAASATRLRALLETNPHTRRFLDEVLADAPHYRPPDEQTGHVPGGLRISPAGDPAPVTADRYTCPHRDCTHTWYRPDLGTPITECPTHQVVLTRG